MRELNKLANISIIFIALCLLFTILYMFQSFLRPFFIACILTLLLAPLTRFTTKKKIVVASSVLLSLALFVGGIALANTFMNEEGSQISTEETQNSLAQKLQEFSEQDFSFFGLDINIVNLIGKDKISSALSNILPSFLNSLTTVVSELFLVLLFLAFLLPSYDLSIARVCTELESRKSETFRNALLQIEESIRSYLGIKALVSLGTALGSGLVMFFFQVDYVLLFSLLTFFLNFIPNIGSFIAVAIVVLFQIFASGFSSSLFLLLALLVLVQIIFGNILEPKIAGKQLELSPIIILLSLFFWGTIWGIGGMLFAVPLTSIIKIVLQNIDATKSVVRYLS
ncbi:AI-2E family transporter [Candidatus Woesearchaeota archaeon]|nr:AI-2E family transporter [Candidatus Woesearchaeota archaeon]USN43583.1 MAG: AI-2E family transporter [Candidatus Woesearchaeota archaeon]